MLVISSIEPIRDNRGKLTCHSFFNYDKQEYVSPIISVIGSVEGDSEDFKKAKELADTLFTIYRKQLGIIIQEITELTTEINLGEIPEPVILYSLMPLI